MSSCLQMVGIFWNLVSGCSEGYWRTWQSWIQCLIQHGHHFDLIYIRFLKVIVRSLWNLIPCSYHFLRFRWWIINHNMATIFWPNFRFWDLIVKFYQFYIKDVLMLQLKIASSNLIFNSIWPPFPNTQLLLELLPDFAEV